MSNLVAKARKETKQKIATYEQDQIDLALAWAKDEVSVRAVARALGYKSPQVYSFLARALRQHIKKRGSG